MHEEKTTGNAAGKSEIQSEARPAHHGARPRHPWAGACGATVLSPVPLVTSSVPSVSHAKSKCDSGGPNDGRTTSGLEKENILHTSKE